MSGPRRHASSETKPGPGSVLVNVNSIGRSRHPWLATLSLLADSNSFSVADGDPDLKAFASAPVTLSEFEIQ